MVYTQTIKCIYKKVMREKKGLQKEKHPIPKNRVLSLKEGDCIYMENNTQIKLYLH